MLALPLLFTGCEAKQKPAEPTETAEGPPATKKQPVTDRFHGTEVTEQYRWLEDSADPAVQAWSDAQNVYARQVLDNLPSVDSVRARVAEIMRAETVRYYALSHRVGRLFAMKRQPPQQQPFLVVMPSAEEPEAERALVDPNAMDSEGGTSIDWFVPSADGKYVAVSLSKDGTESGDVHVYETATGKQVFEVIPRVNGGTAGGDLAWDPKGRGFFYTRYPRGDERPEEDKNFYMQVYWHELGTPTDTDRYEMGKDLPRIAEIQLQMDDGSGRLLATVQKGDGGEFAHYLRSPKGGWRQFSEFGDKTVQATFGPKNDLYVVSTKGAPRGRIVRVPIATLDVSRGKTVVAQGADTIIVDFWGKPTVLPTATRLYVVYQLGGPSEIRVFDLAGKPRPAPAQLPVSAVGGLTPLGGDAVLFDSQSYVEPSAWFRFDPSTGQTTKTALASKSPVDLSTVEVVREFAISKDGTKVPVNILLPKGADRSSPSPTVAYGYGGYGLSLEPWFNPILAVLLEQGVVFAVANLRGGGEYGETWHREGNLTKKQNVFDDFAGVLDHLVDRGYTSNDRLAIMGGSNGGLLMGATMVQHPSAAKAVVSRVGIYDMLRVELSPNGAFNVTEFGTVQDPEQFEALYAYSPYHNVADGVSYPATLFTTGANDPRVDPMQSRKMTARLQEATGSDAPILLRTSADSGHGGDTDLDERIEQYVDVFSFLSDQLGVAPADRQPSP
ncbi:MAG: prolyl oligopeptidase family serine peptidase [Myxococcota bacterium]